MYPGTKTDLTNHNFHKYAIKKEFDDRLESYTSGIELGKINEFPVDWQSAASLKKPCMDDPFLLARALVDKDKLIPEHTSFPKRNIYGNTITFNLEVPLNSRRYVESNIYKNDNDPYPT